MKVALLTAYAGRRAAGLWTAVAEFGRELGHVGVDVDILGLADKSESDAMEDQGVRVRVCSVRGPDAFGYSPDLLKQLTTLEPDLVHTHGLWMYPSWVSHRWSERTGRPRLISPHGMLDPWAIRRSAWKKQTVRWLFEDAHLKGAACLHGLSEAEAKAIRSFGLRNPICVIPNGVDLLQSVPAERSGTRDKTVLFVGRIHPKKGLQELLQGWTTVRCEAEEHGWRLVVAGWGDKSFEADLHRFASEQQLMRTIHFVGPKYGDAKSQIFRSADAFILPSFSEGLPIAVLEAWAYALPALITPQCNLPEGLAGNAALEISPTPDDISRGLRQLFAMTEADRHQMGLAGHRLVETRFAWPIVAERMKSVYDWILGGGHPPACVIRY